jgi:hypothetical protein
MPEQIHEENPITTFLQNDDSHLSQSKLTDEYVRDLMKLNIPSMMPKAGVPLTRKAAEK